MIILNTETIGYIATGLTLGSFLFTDMKYLRTLNIVGCLWWCAYALSFNETQLPILIVNGVIIAIHTIWFISQYFKKLKTDIKL